VAGYQASRFPFRAPENVRAGENAGVSSTGRIFATSDLHIAYQENRQLVEQLDGDHADDWLLVAGDVAEQVQDVVWALSRLRDRFGTVVWVPGNHELWTTPRGNRHGLRGEARYRYLVEACQQLGVLTPEDPYPTWEGQEGPLVVAPLFVLYDYSFRPPGISAATALARARDAGVVCTDEFVLHPDPYPSREAWCWARVESTVRRLTEIPPGRRSVLVSHWPLHRAPTQVLRLPEFSIWCGTELTADWHVRFHAALAVYGHLHIPRTTWYDGVRFEEVSLGYPREWQRRAAPPPVLRQVLPLPPG
jgi:3',5'-cyclic AMP phosphodiesterase CpdA